MDYNWLLFKIKNDNPTIKKIYHSLGKTDYKNYKWFFSVFKILIKLSKKFNPPQIR